MSQIIKHAFLPALISYIALFYIVHLEALKAGLHRPAAAQPGHGRCAAAVLRPHGGRLHRAVAMAVYYGIGWIKGVAGGALPVIGIGLLAAYMGLLKLAAAAAGADAGRPQCAGLELPETAPTLKSGLHFLLQRGGADLVPDGRATLAGALGLLGHGVHDLHPADPAPAGGAGCAARARSATRS
jgi:TRAP-type uncharacterized transport system fused permease subunit